MRTEDARPLCSPPLLEAEGHMCLMRGSCYAHLPRAFCKPLLCRPAPDARQPCIKREPAKGIGPGQNIGLGCHKQRAPTHAAPQAHNKTQPAHAFNTTANVKSRQPAGRVAKTLHGKRHGGSGIVLMVTQLTATRSSTDVLSHDKA